MSIRRSFPFNVERLEHERIPLPDGIHLSARLWLPESAADNPVPAILEYIPYRKREGTAARDALTHPYFAGHGYAAVRVDVRGSGDSDGLLLDEYSPQELADGVAVIQWLTQQPWCNGEIGMMGISWGGFNSLQIAAMRPPGLRAIISLCSTDDRYADDIHYKGGALLNENLGWAGTMLSYTSRPPDPMLSGDTWRHQWLRRLHDMPFWPALWLAHPHRDRYWQHGSICENYNDIQAATLLVGGWGDAYKNPVPRMLRNLNAPCRAILGPWVHKYPHFAVPEPKIGFLQEALRWWDRWLKNDPTGVEADPAMRAYVMHAVRPQHWYSDRPGYWIGEDSWPSNKIPPLRFSGDAAGRLHQDSHPLPFALPIASPQHCGLMGGEYCAIWLGPEMPGDQRRDDAYSLCFDSEPLAATVAVVGGPEVTIQLQSDKPKAAICVRLCDVHPDGAVTRITYGVLNLCCRDSMAQPTPVPVGRTLSVSLKLDEIAYQLPEGHRLRVAVSTNYWPLLWPMPEAATLTVSALGLILPVRPAGASDEVTFPPAETAEPWHIEERRPPKHQRLISEDQVTGLVSLTLFDDFGEVRDCDHGLISGSIGREEWLIHPDDPLSAHGTTHWTQHLARGSWSIRTEAKWAMQSDAEWFHLTGELQAYEDESLVFERTFEDHLPRGHL